MNATGAEKILLLPQVDPAREKEARLMGLRVLQCITHPRFRQRINNVKKLCINTVQYADQRREITSINRGGKKKRTQLQYSNNLL